MNKSFIIFLSVLMSVLSFVSCTKDFIFDEEKLEADVEYKLAIRNTDSLSVERYIRMGIWCPTSILLVKGLKKSNTDYKVTLDGEYLHQIVLGLGESSYNFTEDGGVTEYYTIDLGGHRTGQSHYDSYNYDESTQNMMFDEDKMAFRLVSIDQHRMVAIKKYTTYTGYKVYLVVYELTTSTK